MKRVFGLVFSNMHDHLIGELTANRCMGSIPVGGRYRLIDFVLSSLANSGINQVGVITKNNYQSLLDHLGNGREWDLSRKQGGLTILPPASLAESGGLYGNRIDALNGVMSFLRRSTAKYILMADCDLMANIDYRDFARYHMQSGADITVMYAKVFLDGNRNRDVATFIKDGEGNVAEMLINPDMIGEQNVYINTVILSKELLEWVIHDCITRNLTSFDKDVLQAGVGRYHIKAYEYTGYLSRFHSIQSYYAANLALLDPQVRGALFLKERPVYTRVRDEPPVRYGLDAQVKNSLLADGCRIEGEVENSLLFRGVTVARGAKVSNCILMQGTHVGSGCNIGYTITDRQVTLKDNRHISGYTTYPVYISEGITV